MQMVRHCTVDGVDFWILEQLMVITQRFDIGKVLCKVLEHLGAYITHCLYLWYERERTLVSWEAEMTPSGRSTSKLSAHQPSADDPKVHTSYGRLRGSSHCCGLERGSLGWGE